MYSTLIDTEALQGMISGPDVAVVDCRFNLSDVGWGQQEYNAAHIPGAVYAHLDHHLSGYKTSTNGRHPLPREITLALRLGRWGIDETVQVVAYDQDAGMYASRLWWMLRWLGHERVAVLDGGFARWIAEGRPVASGPEFRPVREFRASPRFDVAVDMNAMIKHVADRSWTLIDARAPERFRGDVEPIDKAAGHIPGAVNHHYMRNVDEGGRFLSPERLRADYQEVLRGAPLDRVVCYCGSGVTACQTLLALEHAGLSGAKLYPGSWSEWSSDPARPIARGE